jgi:hypothetical protein
MEERQLFTRELVEQVVDLCLARVLHQVVASGIDPAIVAGGLLARADDTGRRLIGRTDLRGGFSISASRS